MSEKSDFQIAFDALQKDITSALFELSSSSDFFRECSTFPLPHKGPSTESTVKAKPKNTKKAPKEEENAKVEKHDKEAEQNLVDDEKKEEKDKQEKDKQEKEWTQEEIDNEIILSSKRTQADLTSSKFMKNLKRRIKNVDKSIITKRILALLNEGKIENNHQNQ